MGYPYPAAGGAHVKRQGIVDIPGNRCRTPAPERADQAVFQRFKIFFIDLGQCRAGNGQQSSKNHARANKNSGQPTFHRNLGHNIP